MLFTDLNLVQPILRALTDEGYTTPTPIQRQAIPHALEGRDVLGCAQTGTGKTAAFALPIIQRLMGSSGGMATALRSHVSAPGAPATALGGRGHGSAHHARKPLAPIRALILSPTRELASQIADSFHAYGRHTRLSHTVIFGGVGQNPQVNALRRGVDIVVATPGRLLDLMQQGHVDLSKVEIFVLDEADRMLDMGFIDPIRRIIAKLPQKRQTLFFSATMPRDIQKLADAILNDPARVAVTPVSSTVAAVQQSVYLVEKANKQSLLEHLLADAAVTRALVFTRTKHGADRVCRSLSRADVIAEAIHGNKAQNARQRALANFKSGRTRVLVATDIAARGIDVDGVSHVFNFDLPNEPESYVHRIGRTGRAGASGAALAFCGSDERPYLADIERLIGQRIPVVADHPHYAGRAATNPERQRAGTSKNPEHWGERAGTKQNRDRQGAGAPHPHAGHPRPHAASDHKRTGLAHTSRTPNPPREQDRDRSGWQGAGAPHHQTQTAADRPRRPGMGRLGRGSHGRYGSART